MHFQQKGKNILIFVFIFLLLGLITANPLFYAAGAVMAFWVVFDLAGFLVSLDALNMSMKRNLSRTKLFVGNSLNVKIDLEIHAKNLKDIYFQEAYPAAFTMVSGETTRKIDPGKSSYNFSYNLSAVKRGNHVFAESYLDIESNFHMFKHRAPLGNKVVVSVYPSVLSRKSIAAHYISAQYGRAKSKQKGMGTEVAEIRNYMPGDDIRHIDWKTSLRLNSMFTKEFETDLEPSMFILVDHSRTENPDTMEEAVKIANYLAQYAARNERLGGMVTFTHDRITNKFLIKKGKNRFEIQRSLFTLVPENGKPCAIDMDIGEIKHFERKLKSCNGNEFSILSPFFMDRSEHMKIMESRGVHKAIKQVVEFSSMPSRIAIITDITYDAPLLESVRLATYYGNQVILFIINPLLFRDYDALDLENHYQEYMGLQKKIEKFKRLKSVKVFVVGSEDKPELLINQAVSGWKTRY